MAAANAAAIFVEDDIANPMQPVFDAPVSTPPFEQLGGVRLPARNAGDGVDHFGRLAALDPACAFQAAHLCQAWPVEVTRQTCGSLETPPLATTVPLLNRFRRIEFRLALFLGRGGKKPP